MTTALAARELRISANTFKKLVTAGLFPAVGSRGVRTVVPEGDVHALARRDAVQVDRLGIPELPVLRVGPAERVSGEDRQWTGYAADLAEDQMLAALRGWWRCDPSRVVGAGVLPVTLGPYVVAVLSGLRPGDWEPLGWQAGESERYRFTSAQLAGYVTDLVTP